MPLLQPGPVRLQRLSRRGSGETQRKRPSERPRRREESIRHGGPAGLGDGAGGADPPDPTRHGDRCRSGRVRPGPVEGCHCIEVLTNLVLPLVTAAS